MGIKPTGVDAQGNMKKGDVTKMHESMYTQNILYGGLRNLIRAYVSFYNFNTCKNLKDVGLF